MKISYNWLKDFIDITESPEELSEILTNTGLEVEGVEKVESVKGGLKGLVIGEVLSCEKHPNADKLSLTKVNTGSGEPLSIVCGAPNVATGQKVVVATIGTQLFMGNDSFTIKKSKIRGELSEGMICAEDEIGLGKSHDGILVLDQNAIPGTPAATYFNISNDTVFEIGLTPNRIDAASHFGTARDLAAFFSQQENRTLRKPFLNPELPASDNSLPLNVKIEDPEGCRRFTGVSITGLKIAPSPEWLQNRLKAIGLSPINNVVDITNYVLHELGQPLHAYDADKMAGSTIIVKRLAEGTPFVTLDEVERKLSADDVMVCDAEKGACIGGVFGGLHSGVTESTTNIFLESAYFDPVLVRKTAKRHGVNTDSSFRFERGVDPQNTLVALKRAASLICELAQGKISSEIIDMHPAPIAPWTIDIKYSHIDRLIGKQLPHDLIKRILELLDITIQKEEGDQLKVEVAPYRVDVTREADVIEEILRIYGYNNVEFDDSLRSSISYRNKPDNEKMVNLASDFLSSNGFTEIMSNSLTKSSYYENLQSYQAEQSIPILNPLSADLSVMRQTLLFSGLEAISRNINHKNPNLRLYEYGRIYKLKNSDVSNFENFNEEAVFGLFITGDAEEQSWAAPQTPTSFYQLKAYYLNLLQRIGVNPQSLKIAPLDAYSDLFAGGLNYTFRNESVLRAGLVTPELSSRFDIEQDVFFAEINWSKLLPISNMTKKFSDLPKFPEVRRDLALLLNEEVEYVQVESAARQVGQGILKKVELFDYYKGKNIPEGKKSYAVSFVLQDLKKTLTDKEIDRIMARISDAMKKELHAELR